MAHDQDPLDDAPDPTEDTPESEAEDTAEDDADSGQSDWTPKDRQSATRKITEQGQEIARLRAELELRGDDESDEDEDDDEDDESDEGDGDAYRERLEGQSWNLAEQTYGQEAVAVYSDTYYPMFNRATTPMDHIAALEAYHQARLRQESGEAPEAPAKGGKQSRQQAVQPRIDSNRSDRGPDSDDKVEEARKAGSLSGFADAVASAFGYGQERRGS